MKTFPPQDEHIRDEGHLHTLLVILSGLADNISGFRDQFATKQALCHSQDKGASKSATM
jgi:hypothetical protein